MSKFPCKGTVLQVIAAGGVLAPIGQLISLDVDPAEVETFEDRDLSQSGPSISDSPTGYSSPGAVSGELFYDPTSSGHQVITDLIADPVLSAGESALLEGAIVTPTVVGQTASFDANKLSFGHSYKMNDGIKANFNLGLRTLMTWAATA